MVTKSSLTRYILTQKIFWMHKKRKDTEEWNQVGDSNMDKYSMEIHIVLIFFLFFPRVTGFDNCS